MWKGLLFTFVATTMLASEKEISDTENVAKKFYVGLTAGPSISSDSTNFRPDIYAAGDHWTTPSNGWTHGSIGTKALLGAVFGYQLNNNVGFDIYSLQWKIRQPV